MEKEELKVIYQKHAEANDILLQTDSVILDHILSGLLSREEMYGLRFCPCRRPTGNPEEDKKIVCPCVYHLDEVRDDGHCKCLLFLKK